MSFSTLIAAILLLGPLPDVGTVVTAELTERAIVDTLVSTGFENVSADAQHQKLVVTYENRLYRYDLRALQQVILRSLPLAVGYDTVTIVPRNQDMPLVAVSVATEEFQRLISRVSSPREFVSSLQISFDTTPFEKPLATEVPANKTLGHVDLTAQPSFAFRFGNFDDPVESQVNLVPEIQTRLWPGSSLRVQAIIPIQNELGHEGDFVRPGLVSLNHTHRLPYNVFVSGTVGYFTQNRWGLDSGARVYLMNGRLRAGANVGYTGYLSYRDRTWYYEDLRIWTPSATVGYRLLPQYDLDLQVTYGRFLYQDTGFRVEVERSFGEVQVALFAVASDGPDNVGFAISIPFFGSRYARPSWVRLRPARSIGYSYRYKNIPLAGLWYETGHDLDRFSQNLNPDFILNHLVDLSGWPSEAGANPAGEVVDSGR